MHKTNMAAQAPAEPFYARNDESPDAASHFHQLLDDAIDQKVRTIHLQQETAFCRVRKRIKGKLDEARVDSPTLISELIAELEKISSSTFGTIDTLTFYVVHRNVECHIVCQSCPTTTGMALTLEINHPTNIPEILEQTTLKAESIDNIRQRLNSHTDGLTIVSSPSCDLLCDLYYPLLGELQTLDSRIVSFESSTRKHIPRVSQISVDHAHGMPVTDADHVFIDWQRSRDTTLLNTLLNQYSTATVFIQATNSASAIRQLTDLAISERQLATNLTTCIELDHAHLICPHCAEAHNPNGSEIRIMEQHRIKANSTLNYAPGCDRCNYTGIGEHRLLLSLCSASDAIRLSVETRSTDAIAKSFDSALKKQSIREQRKRLISAGQMNLQALK